MRNLAPWLLIACLGALCACGRANSGSTTATPAAASAPTNATPVAADAGVEASISADDSDSANDDSRDPQLTPLSTDDIQFYLTVMHTAADRVQHPTAADLAAQQHEQAVVAGAPAQEAASQAALVKSQAASKEAMAAAMSGDQAAVMKFNAQAIAALAPATAAPSPGATDAVDHALLLHGQVDTLIVRERHLDEHRYNRVRDTIEEIIVPPALNARASCGRDCPEAPTPTAQQIERQRVRDVAMAANRKTLAPYRDEIHSLQAIVRPLPSDTP